MSKNIFTTQQQQAIDTKGCDILVAAAAGSGKTAVLVERIIQSISDKKNPINIDELLVVTFTDSAAKEMKQRISNAISNLIEDNPHDEHLQQQISLLPKAQITTIHSFCLKIIRQNFHLIDIDPNFRIADTIEINLIKNEVINNLFEEQYNIEKNYEFYNLVESYGGKIKDTGLQDLILNIYDFSESNPWPDKFIKNSVDIFSFDYKNINQTMWSKILLKHIKNSLEGVLTYIEIGINICEKDFGPNIYAENFDEDKFIVQFLLKNCDTFENIYTAFLNKDNFSRLKTIKKSERESIDTILLDKAKNIRENYVKKIIQKIDTDYFFKSPKEMLEDIKFLYPSIKFLGDLVLEFSKIYQEIKKEKIL